MKAEKIGLSNNFVFQEAMSDEKVAKPFLEALLGKRIKRIEYVNREQNEKADIPAHGIRLDVYINDSDGTVYNIEMQQLKDALEQRSRYYQSGIDRITLAVGCDYDDLKESFVIFVCCFDYYNKGNAKYERTSFINGDMSIPFADGSHVIFLNAEYKDSSDVDPAIAEFLDLVRTGDVEKTFSSVLAQEAANAVKRVRADEGKVVRYMTLEMEMNRREKVGRDKEFNKSIIDAFDYLGNIEDVAKMRHTTVENVTKILVAAGRIAT